MTAIRYPKGMTLDLGCGTGAHLKGMKNVIGLDISPVNIEKARKFGVPLVLGDMCNMPFKDGMFTKVFASHSLEHASNWEVAIQEIWRVLSENGIVEIHVPMYDSDPHGNNDGCEFWASEFEVIVRKYFQICNVAIGGKLPDLLGPRAHFYFLPATFRIKIVYPLRKLLFRFHITEPYETEIIGKKLQHPGAIR